MQLYIKVWSNNFSIESSTKKFSRVLDSPPHGRRNHCLNGKDILELIALLQEALAIEENGLEIITNTFREKSPHLYIGCCPFHEEVTPSCVYYPLRDRFHCFGCSEEGETQKLAAQLMKAKETKESL